MEPRLLGGVACLVLAGKCLPGLPCPSWCLCPQSALRCVHLMLDRIPQVPPQTTVLYDRADPQHVPQPWPAHPLELGMPGVPSGSEQPALTLLRTLKRVPWTSTEQCRIQSSPTA
ncbi:Peroxidasin-like protein [Tupaia chinensis]|uniref:Peroxidasin-like protein n=1 Tax=Tupaia chinensis TaxID=246437 RepID=L9LC25_TUPCH|nr:Peroxidasin-like protein [Tupaia chinensis]